MQVLPCRGGMTQQLVNELQGANVPHVIVGGNTLMDFKVTRDALAYCQLAANPANDPAFLRILKQPPRGIGASVQSPAALHCPCSAVAWGNMLYI